MFDLEFQAQCRQLLQEELERRLEKNPQYSLRAFAHSLDLDSSFLSKVLSGKRNITLATFEKMSAQLSVSAETLFKLQRRAKAKGKLGGYIRITRDQLAILSEWEHFAILEILNNKPKATNKKIAYHLGLSEIRVKESIERLKRAQYLDWNENDQRYEILSPNNTTVGGASTAALRALQKNFLQKAQNALDEVPEAERDQSGMTMMIDREKMPEAKKLIKKFRRELCELLETPEKREQMYQLTVSLFPLAKSSWRDD